MTEVINRELVDFSSCKSPDWYQCGQCRATNCKLWRHNNTVMLRCLVCVGALYPEEEIDRVNEDGCRPSRVLANSNHIASFVPAFPDNENGGFYMDQYASTESKEWWRRLPLEDPEFC